METGTITEPANALAAQISVLEQEIMDKKQELARLRRSVAPQPVPNYALLDKDGRTVRLLEMFGDKDELIAVHNMGRGCSYCTMWADGFSSVNKHLRDRAGFVVVSSDAPAVMKEFALSRGWEFDIYSGENSTFKSDLGYQSADGRTMPGVTVFRRDPDGTIWLTSSAYFGPGDSYCIVWDMLDLLPSGWNGWHPRLKYDPA